MRSFLPFLAAAVVGMPFPSHAAPIGTVQVKVSAAGLDLATEAGASEFLHRLARAATRVCGGYPDPSPLAFNAEQRFQICRATALAGAVSQSGSEALKRQFAASREAELIRLAAR